MFRSTYNASRIYKCINKTIKNGKVVEYILQDVSDGSLRGILRQDLKYKLRQGTIRVLNLKLTGSNKIISANKEEIEKLEKIEAKAKLMGWAVSYISANSGYCLVISRDENNHVMYIPKGVKNIHINSDNSIDVLCDMVGNLKVKGGEDLESTYHLFSGVRFNTIDLTEFNMGNVKDASYMFLNSTGDILGVEDLDTHNLVYAKSMFNSYRFNGILDLRKWNTNKVKYVSSMLKGVDHRKLFLGEDLLTKYNTIGETTW